LTFCSTSKGNLIIILANNDVAKNIEEEVFIFKMTNSQLLWGEQKVTLLHPEYLENKEKSKWE